MPPAPAGIGASSGMASSGLHENFMEQAGEHSSRSGSIAVSSPMGSRAIRKGAGDAEEDPSDRGVAGAGRHHPHHGSGRRQPRSVCPRSRTRLNCSPATALASARAMPSGTGPATAAAWPRRLPTEPATARATAPGPLTAPGTPMARAREPATQAKARRTARATARETAAAIVTARVTVTAPATATAPGAACSGAGTTEPAQKLESDGAPGCPGPHP